jgi:hypothetical protein
METILANLIDEYFEAEVDALAEKKARERTRSKLRRLAISNCEFHGTSVELHR